MHILTPCVTLFRLANFTVVAIFYGCSVQLSIQFQIDSIASINSFFYPSFTTSKFTSSFYANSHPVKMLCTCISSVSMSPKPRLSAIISFGDCIQPLRLLLIRMASIRFDIGPNSQTHTIALYSQRQLEQYN